MEKQSSKKLRHYALGHNDDELARLSLQAAVLEPTTRRLIAEAGVAPGMRVLDLGCGTGEASLLIADAVGPTGIVVGLDREEAAVVTARNLASQRGYANVCFQVGDEDQPAEQLKFDVVLIRYLLIHQSDPVAFLRRVRHLLKPGGLLLSEEAAFHLSTRCTPHVPLWTSMFDTISSFTAACFPNHDAAGRVVGLVTAAGLDVKEAFAISLVGGPFSAYLAYGVASYRAFLPAIRRQGLERGEVGDPDTLEQRINEQMVLVDAQFIGCPDVIVRAVRASDGNG